MSLLWCVGLLAMAVRFVDIRYLSALLMPMLYPHSLLHFRWLLVLYTIEGAVSKTAASLNTNTPYPTDKNAPRRKRFAQVFELVWVLLLDGWSGALKQPSGHDGHGSNSSSSSSSSKGSSSLYTRGHSLHGVLFVACVLLLFVKYHHRTYPSRICLPQSRNDC
eukprot:COSAG01_NODE_3516_length_5981_cov_5.929446_3_plen_163_part_00